MNDLQAGALEPRSLVAGLFFLTLALSAIRSDADAVAGIDQVIAGIKSVLSAEVAALTTAIIAPATAATTARKKGNRRRGRGHFDLSAEVSILAFVKQHKKPTTHDINQHFKDKGRSATANNALGKLVREKKLKRMPLGKGVRGKPVFVGVILQPE